MKVIIAGSRDITNYNVVKRAIRKAAQKRNIHPTTILSGGCRGVDGYGQLYAQKYDIPVKIYPAKWNKYGRAAGPRRNRKMSKKADALIAVWDGQSTGTKNMIDIMISKAKPIYIHLVK